MKNQGKKIILGRHGQTVFNRDGYIQGRADSPLTFLGIPEIRRLPSLAAPERPSVVFASSLGRAAFTGSIYSQELSAPIYFRDSIVELSCGIWEGMRRSDVKGWSNTIRETWDDRPPEGESYADAEERVRSFINEINLLESHSTILVIAHAGLNRVFLKLWLGMDPESARMIRCPHDTLYILEPGGHVKRKHPEKIMDKGFLLEFD